MKTPGRIIYSRGEVALNQLGLENSFKAGLLVIKLLGPCAGIFQTRIFRGGADDTTHRGLGQMPKAGEAVNAKLPGGSKLDQRWERNFLLVLECLPGITSVPLPGHFAREGSNFNERH